MKRTLALIACLLLSLPVTAAFYSGNAIYEEMKVCEQFESLPDDADMTNENYEQMESCGFVQGFIAGVYDAYQGIEHFPECFPKGTNLGQVEDVSKNYLRSHPERRDMAAKVLVLAAIKEAWSCTE